MKAATALRALRATAQSDVESQPEKNNKQPGGLHGAVAIKGAARAASSSTATLLFVVLDALSEERVIPFRTFQDIRYTFVSHKLHACAAGIYRVVLALPVLRMLSVGAIQNRNLYQRQIAVRRHVYALHHFQVLCYSRVLDTLVLNADERIFTIAAVGACSIIIAHPIEFCAEVRLLQADIAGGTVITVAALPAVARAGHAHIGVGVAEKTLGAGAQWTALIGPVLEAAMGAAIGATLFAETACGGVAVLLAQPFFRALVAHLTDTTAAHAATSIAAAFLVLPIIRCAIRVADLANVDFDVVIGVRIDIARPARRADSTGPTIDAHSSERIALQGRIAVVLNSTRGQADAHAP